MTTSISGWDTLSDEDKRIAKEFEKVGFELVDSGAFDDFIREVAQELNNEILEEEKIPKSKAVQQLEQNNINLKNKSRSLTLE